MHEMNYIYNPYKPPMNKLLYARKFQNNVELQAMLKITRIYITYIVFIWQGRRYQNLNFS